MSTPRSDEMSLDIVLAVLAGVVVGVAVVAAAGGICYLSGLAFGAAAWWLGLIAAAATTVVTLLRLERSAAGRVRQSQKVQSQ
jgi:hypothetical protein